MDLVDETSDEPRSSWPVDPLTIATKLFKSAEELFLLPRDSDQ